MISFDLDMTLLDHRTDQITPSALEAIEKLRPKHRAGLGWLCYGSEDTAGTPASRADAAHRPLGAGETTADHAKPAKARNMRRAVGLAAAGCAPAPHKPGRPEATRCRDDTGRRRSRGG